MSQKWQFQRDVIIEQPFSINVHVQNVGTQKCCSTKEVVLQKVSILERKFQYWTKANFLVKKVYARRTVNQISTLAFHIYIYI